jgi:hypothetical protein
MQLHQARLEARERAALQRAGQRSRRGE